LRFENGRLSLPAIGWVPPQVDQLRSRLGATGWALDNAEGRLVIHRAAMPGTGTPAAGNPAGSTAAGNTTTPRP
jgi:hypothetical protein